MSDDFRTVPDILKGEKAIPEYSNLLLAPMMPKLLIRFVR